MFFNSIDYAVFLPIVFILYWTFGKKDLKFQNILLLASSYFFYACWDWRFMLLLIFSSALDFFTGIKIYEASNSKTRKFWLWLSIGINLSFLGVFKYYNFFVDSFAEVLSTVGVATNFSSLQVILPVGISFYTFHGLSYVIDVYKNKIEPERNIIDYSVFVSFFALLVAGPIERATHLLPQMKKMRVFDRTKAIDGLRQILWGLFKKVVIADNCAIYADAIFNNSNDYSGSTHVLGALFFTIQIYCDFSGYSDIAIGTARLFGIDLLRNFAFPYFSRNIKEFWRRWHISLSSWFKDYVYIPLGGSKGGMWMKVRNTFIIFLVTGFWHGANWTFIIWGLLNALYIMPSIVFNTNRNNIDIVAKGKVLPSIKEFGAIGLTFILTVFAWIFFRAESVTLAFSYVSEIFSLSLFEMPQFRDRNREIIILFITLLFFIIEWLGRDQEFALAKLGCRFGLPIRYLMYYSIIFAIFWFSRSEAKQFIYFQF